MGALAGVAYSGFLIDLWTPSGGLDVTTVVSSLEVSGPHARLLRALDIVSGLLTLALVPFLASALPRGRLRGVAVWGTVAFAVGGALTGVVHLPCADGAPGCPDGIGQEAQQVAHDLLSAVSTFAMVAAAVAVSLLLHRRGPRWMVWAGWLAAGVVVGTSLVFGAESATVAGVAQRGQILAVSAWVICLGAYAATDGLRAARLNPPSWWPRGRPAAPGREG